MRNPSLLLLRLLARQRWKRFLLPAHRQVSFRERNEGLVTFGYLRNSCSRVRLWSVHLLLQVPRSSRLVCCRDGTLQASRPVRNVAAD